QRPARRVAVDGAVHLIEVALDDGGERSGVDAVAAAAGVLALRVLGGGDELLEAGRPGAVFLAGVLCRIVDELPARPPGLAIPDDRDRLPHRLADRLLTLEGVLVRRDRSRVISPEWGAGHHRAGAERGEDRCGHDGRSNDGSHDLSHLDDVPVVWLT